MAYFNPNRVDFNYNTNMIDAVGAVGRSLWDIYKENVTKNQNQMKINETMRSNLASEALTGARDAETARHHAETERETANDNAFNRQFKQSELGIKTDQWQKDYDLRQKQLNENIALRKQQMDENAAFRNAMLQDRKDAREAKLTAADAGAMPTVGGISASALNPKDFFETNKDNKQFAAMFGGLDENTGAIDYARAAQNFVNYVTTNRTWGKNITDKLNKDDNFDKEMTGLSEGTDKLGQAGEEFAKYGKPLDSYDGWGDRVLDWFAEKAGVDNGSQSAQNLAQILTNTGVQLTKLGRADREIQDLTKEVGVKLNGAIFDNDTALKAERLNNRIFNIEISSLRTKRDATKDGYQRYAINSKIKELEAQRDKISDAILGKTKIPKKYTAETADEFVRSGEYE